MLVKEGTTPASFLRQVVRADAGISRWSYSKGSRSGRSLQLMTMLPVRGILLIWYAGWRRLELLLEADLRNKWTGLLTIVHKPGEAGK